MSESPKSYLSSERSYFINWFRGEHDKLDDALYSLLFSQQFPKCYVFFSGNSLVWVALTNSYCLLTCTYLFTARGLFQGISWREKEETGRS